MTDPVLLRPMVPGDENFVLSTWLRDLRQADPSGLPDEHWFPAHRAFIQSLLRDRSIAVVIACASDQPREILGFIAGVPGEVLEWVTTRKRLRGRGLAKRLLLALGFSPSSPPAARWSTPDARKALQFQLQSRKLRLPDRQLSPASPSASSPR